MAIKLSWTLPALLLAAASAASAATNPCVGSSLFDYTGLGMGCTIDSTLYSNFRAFSSFGTMLDPMAIQVNPLQLPSQNGFRFDFNQLAGPNQAFGIQIAYTVSSALGATVTMNGSSVQPDGANTAILNVCSGGSYDPTGPTNCTGSESFAIAFDTGSTSSLSESLAFPAGKQDVVLDVVIDGGLTGSAQLNSVTAVSDVPEPATLSILATGVFAMVARKLIRKPNQQVQL